MFAGAQPYFISPPSQGYIYDLPSLGRADWTYIPPNATYNPPGASNVTQSEFDKGVFDGFIVPRGIDVIPRDPQSVKLDSKFEEAVRSQIRELGYDPDKLTSAQINHVAAQFNVPESVRSFDPQHPVFGTIGDGHIIKWIWDNRATIIAIAKILMMLLPLL